MRRVLKTRCERRPVKRSGEDRFVERAPEASRSPAVQREGTGVKPMTAVGAGFAVSPAATSVASRQHAGVAAELDGDPECSWHGAEVVVADLFPCEVKAQAKSE